MVHTTSPLPSVPGTAQQITADFPPLSTLPWWAKTDPFEALLTNDLAQSSPLLAQHFQQAYFASFGQRFEFLSTSARSLKRDWPYVGHDLHNRGNQRTEKEIGTDNVAFLEEEWRFDVLSGVDINGLGVSGQPTVADGTAYFADANGIIYAVDADSGELQWATEIPEAQFATSPTLTRNLLYISESEDPSAPTTSEPGRIFCLNRHTGEIVWDAPLDTSTLPSVIGAPINHLSYSGDTAVVGRLVIVGVASAENVLAPGDNAARGSVVAYDRFTGEEEWRFFTTSDQSLTQPEFGGGVGVWSSPAIDIKRKLLFIGTGQAYEYPPTLDSRPPAEYEPGSLASPYSDSLLALDYRTGELVWHKQFTPDDVFGANTGFEGLDHDVGAHPNLFSIRAQLPSESKSTRHDLVGVGDKGGKYYILSRDRDQGPDSDSIEILATLDLDPGGSLGGIQSTAAFDRGILYIASHAQVVDGQRVATDVRNFFVQPSTAAFSTKIVAVDVRALLEGEAPEAYILWETEEAVGEEPTGMTLAPLTIANGVLYHASTTGELRALDASTGVELFRDVVLTFDHPDPAVGEIPVPLFGGATIADGSIIVAAGTSYVGALSGQPSAVISYGLPDDIASARAGRSFAREPTAIFDTTDAPDWASAPYGQATEYFML
jgi:polyvinyl alcohol dehydrogenase (cytochrome)